MIDTKESLVGNISQEQEVNGAVNKGIEIIQPTLQEKTTTPTEQIQQITPDENYDGLSQVTVNAIPSQYIVPTGTLNITTNGNYNVTNYETANVQTSGADLTEYFYTEITENTSSSSKMSTKIVKKIPDVTVSNNVKNLYYAYDGVSIGKVPKVIFNNNVTGLDCIFNNVGNCAEIDTTGMDTSNVTSMYRMFYFYGQKEYVLTNIIFGSSFNTTKTTYMKEMFGNRAGLTSLDLSNWETPVLTNVQNMFAGCSGLTHLDIRKMTFDRVTTSSGMFGTNSATWIPANCEIIVKDATAKAWVLNVRSDLTNVKTVAEYEGG